MRRKITCESCSFEGTLSYTLSDFSPSDICYCPVCGNDISEAVKDQDDSDEEPEFV